MSSKSTTSVYARITVHEGRQQRQQYVLWPRALCLPPSTTALHYYAPTPPPSLPTIHSHAAQANTNKTIIKNKNSACKNTPKQTQTRPPTHRSLVFLRARYRSGFGTTWHTGQHTKMHAARENGLVFAHQNHFQRTKGQNRKSLFRPLNVSGITHHSHQTNPFFMQIMAVQKQQAGKRPPGGSVANKANPKP